MKTLILAVALAAAPAAAQTQSNMTQSSSAQFARADAALNAAYRVAAARLSSNGKARLVKAQRSWIAWRNAECAFRSNGADAGSIGTMVALDCSTELTRARTTQLDALKQCAEGDTSCPN